MVILSAQRKNSGLSLLSTNLDRSSMIEIQPMVSGEVAQVRAILIAGLTERWGRYDAGFNPDIEAFPESYRDALTLVARDVTGPVGTGTLKFIGQGQAEIVRMSVAHTHRQRGIGGDILSALLEAAQSRGYQSVVLETTSVWVSAVNFYLSHGFRKTHERGDDTFFEYVWPG
jgi:ribosomal protein S18 acetylase RimI-like enzyme